MINLEQLTARYAQGITGCISETWQYGNPVEAKNAENYITKALGILQENGIYASIVYLLSRANSKDRNNRYTEESTCCIYILWQLLALLSDPGIGNLNLSFRPETPIEEINNRKTQILNYISDRIANTIDNVLITHRLFEQTLIFARYGAKALRGN